MVASLPEDATRMLDWTWANLQPFYEDLIGRRLMADTVHGFLRDWTRIDERVDEVGRRLRVATTRNTADAQVERRLHFFLDTVHPQVQDAEQRLRQKLFASGLEVSGFEVPLRKMRAQAEIFREANLPLLSEEQKLALEHNKVLGAQTVVWEGKERTVSSMRPLLERPDRALRERAWRAIHERWLADRGALNNIWARLLDLRGRIAGNAGFFLKGSSRDGQAHQQSDYRAYRWQQLLRFDYTPSDCAAFRDAIREVVLPAAVRIYERRRKALGVDVLRPWDLDVDPLSRPPLTPFTDAGELEARCAAMFHRVDEGLARHFEVMRREGLLDLANRKNKGPGGYCTTFEAAHRAFIFMNAVGLHADVQTLLHEAGHAFHLFERAGLPYIQQRQVGAEFSEVASMAMELLAAPYLTRDDGGFYTPADSVRARVDELERMILFWPYMAIVDGFQHWVYEHPQAAMDPSNCGREWRRLWEQFMRGVDWTGFEDTLATGWQRKHHIHTYPFYYVEYGLAQLGAVQLWARALKDQRAAVSDYRRALALGGTRPLPELFDAAGARFTVEAEPLRAAVSLMEETIGRLQAH